MTTNDVGKRLRAEREKIERDAMLDQRGWMAFLDRLSDQGREKALRPLLRRSTFDKWRVLTDVLSQFEAR
jgi:hypothetical protein